MAKEKIFAFFQLIIDLLIIVVSYYGVVYIRELLGRPYSATNIFAVQAILPYLLIIYIFLFFIYNLHEIEELDFYETFLGVIFSVIILVIFALALSFWFRAFAVPRTIVLYSFVIQLILMPVFHYLLYRIYLSITPPLKMLILSHTNESAAEIEKYIKSVKGGRVSIARQIVDKNNFSAIKNNVNKFDAFIVSGDLNLKKEELVRFFAYRDKPVYVEPGLYELMLLNSKIHVVSDKMFLEVNAVNISWFDKLLKRVLDVSVAVVALILFSPIISLVSILILINSGRPIFYLQERVGVNGRTFKTIKFRTMIKDAEKNTGAVLSSENDPRVTKVGKFLRKTGIDEIPQFINVLKGEMSVVGPRPERPELIEKIKKDVPDFDLRLKVKPGITGFAQLAGKYDTPFGEKLKLDIAYAKQKYTFLVDIYVMLNTVKLFFLPKKRK